MLASAGALHQVFLNLITNALDALAARRPDRRQRAARRGPAESSRSVLPTTDPALRRPIASICSSRSSPRGPREPAWVWRSAARSSTSTAARIVLESRPGARGHVPGHAPARPVNPHPWQAKVNRHGRHIAAARDLDCRRRAADPRQSLRNCSRRKAIACARRPTAWRPSRHLPIPTRRCCCWT